MHCPNCGKETGADVKFCRVCGMKLDSVARAVSEHLGGEEPLTPAKKGSGSSVRRKTVNTIFTGFLMVVIGAVILSLWKDIPWLKTTGVLFALLGMLVSVYGVLYPATRGGEREPRRASPAKEIEPSPAAELPAGDDFEPALSVTEATTRDLDGNKKTKAAR